MLVPYQSIKSRCVLSLDPDTDTLFWSGRVPIPETGRPHDLVHIVQPGETLLHIAHQYYKDVRLWWAIYDNNVSKIRLHPFDLPVLMELIIPSLLDLEKEVLHDRNI